MPSALTMRAKIQKVKDAHALSLVELDAEIDAELKSVAEQAARTVDDVRTKLKSDVDAQKAEISALRDELNQMTNGGPPLGGSESSEGQSEGAAASGTTVP